MRPRRDVVDDIRVFLAEAQDRRVLEGLSFVLHRLVSTKDEPALLSAIASTYNECALEGKPAPAQMNAFLELMLLNSRPLSFDALVDLKVALRKERAFGAVEKVIALIEEAVARRSPVISRWHADPASDMLGWMAWEDEHVAQSLNVLVQPFWQLRSHEFSQPYGRNVVHLNNVANSLSVFVVASTLAGCSMSKSTGAKVAARWVRVAKLLQEMGNFHMLFAIQCGLCKHQLERLPNLIAGRERRVKQQLDELFDPNDRFQKVAALWCERAGRAPTVVAVFWLVQKALLLEENPLRDTKSGRLNAAALLAAYNAFHVLRQAQSVPAATSPANLPAECGWYFLEIARAFRDGDEMNDRLYALSDKVKGDSSSDRSSSPSNKTLLRSKTEKAFRKLSLEDMMPLEDEEMALPARHSSSAPVLQHVARTLQRED